MIKKTVTFAITLFVAASIALVGCGSSEETTEEGLDSVKKSSEGQQAIEYGSPSDGSDSPSSDLKMPPGKSGGK